uniref:hypothetical protein n=1 Tax=Bacteroidales TaxID=171549 RepID=UPI002648106C
YAISNRHFEEILEMLESLKDLPGKDLRTINKKRRAEIIIRKLNKSKQIDYEKVIGNQRKQGV